MNNIWQELSKPIMCLAPMEGVTDTVFRRLLAEIGKPDLMFTEFVNVDGLYSKGRKAVLDSLRFKKVERPLIAQVWGLRPENYAKAAYEIVEMGFDGIDINMGCPVKKIISKGACSGLIRDKAKAAELIHATKQGTKGLIPVSVKTRIGFDTIETDSWISFLLEQGIDALTIHGRTRAEMSMVPCHWDEIGKAVEIRNSMQVETVIIGNGDVSNLDEAKEKVLEWGVDGVMIGRGIFADPELFGKTSGERLASKRDKLLLLLRHMDLFEEVWSNEKPFEVLKRYFKIYVREFDDASELRDNLVRASSYKEVRDLVTYELE